MQSSFLSPAQVPALTAPPNPPAPPAPPALIAPPAPPAHLAPRTHVSPALAPASSSLDSDPPK